MQETAREWQLEVTEKLATLIQQTNNLVSQVSRQNGNVAKLWTEMDRVKAEINAAAVKSAESEAGRAATAKAAGWGFEEIVKPILYLLIGAVITLVLANSGLFGPHGSSSSITTSTESKTSAK